MSFQPPQQPTKKRLGGLRIFALVLFGITALLFLIAILASGSNTNNDDQAAAAATTAATADTTTSEPAETQPAPPPEPTTAAIPTEYKSALRQAQSYLDYTPFSQAGLYDQLTSQYGGQFSPEAAQYAVDNVGADWNQQALRAAIQYHRRS